MHRKQPVKRIIAAAAALLILLASASCGKTPAGPDGSDVSSDIGSDITTAIPTEDTGKDTDTSAPEGSTTSSSPAETTAPGTGAAHDDTTPAASETSKTPESTKAPETEKPTTTIPEETTKMNVPDEPTTTVLNYADKKCMWLSQFDLNKVYANGGSQRSSAQFTGYIKKILANVKKDGINTIIVQVRPYADSMYPSDVYPMSSYVVGAYGKEASYDPYAIVIDEAHALGLSVHAWINPMRAMLVKEITKVPQKYRIRSWYDDTSTRGKYVVTVGDRFYLNPAYPEVRQLIIDGAAEILARYKVDGLHMDDYFYPTQDASFDSAAYSAYKKDGGKSSLADFRRDCLSKLVAGLYSTVKAADGSILFGISPAGNINTVYEKQYADVYRWCSEKGYLDYICPQVYFGLEHQTYDFKKVSKTLQSIIKTDSVELIIGMTLGKAKSGTDQYAGSGKNEWKEHKDVLVRCLEYTKSLEKCRGVAYFCYQYFYDPISGASVSETKTERDNFIPLLKTITWTDR